MKKILFPTDFSEAAINAFVYALNIADHFGASITTVHAYELPQLQVNLPNTLRQVYESIDVEEFESYKDAVPTLNKIAAENGLSHIPIDHVMRRGEEVVDIILTEAKASAADLIVLGTTGATGLKEVFTGSVAGEVSENAEVPVLAVPQQAKFDGKIDKIAFGTSFKEIEKAALRQLIDFARVFPDARIYCVNVDTSKTTELTELDNDWQAEFADYPNVESVILRGDKFEETLTTYLEANAIDFITMVTQKRNFWQELFHFSKSKKLAYHAKTPVLSIQLK